MRRRSSSSKRGFSLVEVMAASAIFGAGLAAIFSAFTTSSNLFEHQRHTTHGIHLAEAKMEELLLRNKTDIELNAGTTFGPVWFDSRGFPAGSGCPGTAVGLPPETKECRYRVTWISQPSGVPGIRNTSVTTTWNERGTPKFVSFSTQRN